MTPDRDATCDWDCQLAVGHTGACSRVRFLIGPWETHYGHDVTGYKQPRITSDVVDPEWPHGDENHCWRGHEFTHDNTYVDPKGVKICRTCSRHNKREYKRRRREARVQ